MVPGRRSPFASAVVPSPRAKLNHARACWCANAVHTVNEQNASKAHMDRHSTMPVSASTATTSRQPERWSPSASAVLPSPRAKLNHARACWCENAVPTVKEQNESKAHMDRHSTLPVSASTETTSRRAGTSAPVPSPRAKMRPLVARWHSCAGLTGSVAGCMASCNTLPLSAARIATCTNDLGVIGKRLKETRLLCRLHMKQNLGTTLSCTA